MPFLGSYTFAILGDGTDSVRYVCRQVRNKSYMTHVGVTVLRLLVKSWQIGLQT